jgi:hypothetical protein
MLLLNGTGVHFGAVVVIVVEGGRSHLYTGNLLLKFSAWGSLIPHQICCETSAFFVFLNLLMEL